MTADQPADTLDPNTGRAWSGRTRGGVWGNRLFLWVLKLLGLRAAYALVIPVACWFTLSSKTGRNASIKLREHLGNLPTRGFAGWYWTWRHFFSFGRILIDRVVALSAKHCPIQFELDGHQHILDAVNTQRGVILLSAHFGNWEVATRSFEKYNIHKPINVVAYMGETRAMQQLLDNAQHHRPFNIIALDGTASATMGIVAALNRGEIVAMHGDRCLHDPGVACDFLGQTAYLPTGPHIAAAVANATMVHVFATRKSTGIYQLKAYPPMTLQFTSRARRSADIQQWCRLFADRLAEQVAQKPLQWLNFYDYWAPPATNAERKET